MIEKLSIEWTKNIIKNTLQLDNEKLINNKTILIYDLNSTLSNLISHWYIFNLNWKYNSEIYLFDESKVDFYKNLLLWLNKNDTVILVQSTNFRMENFRIRILLQQKWISCIEHNHLSYIKENNIINYLNSINLDYNKIDILSNKLKSKFDIAEKLEVISRSWKKFIVKWWFEDMKRNSWIYNIDSRYATFPAWENFSEAKDFLKVSWILEIRAYPWLDFIVRHLDEPFFINVENSIIKDFSNNTPEDFIEIFEKIKVSESEVMIRELGFWLNPEITFDNKLDDVNAFERLEWFHLSIWKKHNIYRKKLNKDVIQRYHIDIFPSVEKIILDNSIIYENNKFL